MSEVKIEVDSKTAKHKIKLKLESHCRVGTDSSDGFPGAANVDFKSKETPDETKQAGAADDGWNSVAALDFFAEKYIKYKILFDTKHAYTQTAAYESALRRLALQVHMPFEGFDDKCRLFRVRLFEYVQRRVRACIARGEAAEEAWRGAPPALVALALRLRLLHIAVQLELNESVEARAWAERALLAALCGGGGGRGAEAGGAEGREALVAAAAALGPHAALLSRRHLCYIWDRVRSVRRSLPLQLASGEERGRSAGLRLGTRASRLLDTLLLYDPAFPLVTQWSLGQRSWLCSLTALTQCLAAARPALRRAATAAATHRHRAELWARVLTAYRRTGRVSSAVLLQRQWHQVCAAARDAILRAALDRPPEPPHPLLLLVAKLFPYVIVQEKPATWSELVEGGRVVTDDHVDYLHGDPITVDFTKLDACKTTSDVEKYIQTLLHSKEGLIIFREQKIKDTSTEPIADRILRLDNVPHTRDAHTTNITSNEVANSDLPVVKALEQMNPASATISIVIDEDFSERMLNGVQPRVVIERQLYSFKETAADASDCMEDETQESCNEFDAKLLQIPIVKLTRIDSHPAWDARLFSGGSIDVRDTHLYTDDTTTLLTERPKRKRLYTSDTSDTSDNWAPSDTDTTDTWNSSDTSDSDNFAPPKINKRVRIKRICPCKEQNLRPELDRVSRRVLTNVNNKRLLEMCKPAVVRLRECDRTPCQGRVVKKVRLADIDEVRRINRSILTAQVVPITADSDSRQKPRQKQPGQNERLSMGGMPEQTSEDDNEDIFTFINELASMVDVSVLAALPPSPALPRPPPLPPSRWPRRASNMARTLRNLSVFIRERFLAAHDHLQAMKKAAIEEDSGKYVTKYLARSQEDTAKKKKKKNKEKGTEDRESCEQADLDPLGEWQRQKSLNNKYFKLGTLHGPKRKHTVTTQQTQQTEQQITGQQMIGQHTTEQQTTNEYLTFDNRQPNINSSDWTALQQQQIITPQTIYQLTPEQQAAIQQLSLQSTQQPQSNPTNLQPVFLLNNMNILPPTECQLLSTNQTAQFTPLQSTPLPQTTWQHTHLQQTTLQHPLQQIMQNIQLLQTTQQNTQTQQAILQNTSSQQTIQNTPLQQTTQNTSSQQTIQNTPLRQTIQNTPLQQTTQNTQSQQTTQKTPSQRTTQQNTQSQQAAQQYKPLQTKKQPNAMSKFSPTQTRIWSRLQSILKQPVRPITQAKQNKITTSGTIHPSSPETIEIIDDDEPSEVKEVTPIIVGACSLSTAQVVDDNDCASETGDAGLQATVNPITGLNSLVAQLPSLPAAPPPPPPPAAAPPPPAPVLRRYLQQHYVNTMSAKGSTSSSQTTGIPVNSPSYPHTSVSPCGVTSPPPVAPVVSMPQTMSYQTQETPQITLYPCANNTHIPSSTSNSQAAGIPANSPSYPHTLVPPCGVTSPPPVAPVVNMPQTMSYQTQEAPQITLYRCGNNTHIPTARGNLRSEPHQFLSNEVVPAWEITQLSHVMLLDMAKPLWTVAGKYLIVTDRYLPCEQPSYWTLGEPCRRILFPDSTDSDNEIVETDTSPYDLTESRDYLGGYGDIINTNKDAASSLISETEIAISADSSDVINNKSDSEEVSVVNVNDVNKSDDDSVVAKSSVNVEANVANANAKDASDSSEVSAARDVTHDVINDKTTDTKGGESTDKPKSLIKVKSFARLSELEKKKPERKRHPNILVHFNKYHKKITEQPLRYVDLLCVVTEASVCARLAASGAALYAVSRAAVAVSRAAGRLQPLGVSRAAGRLQPLGVSRRPLPRGVAARDALLLQFHDEAFLNHLARDFRQVPTTQQYEEIFIFATHKDASNLESRSLIFK